MLIFLDEPQGQEETLLAGLKPLPRSRMLKQAGREAQSFYTRGSYGEFVRKKDGTIWKSGPEGRQVPLREKNRQNAAREDRPKVMPDDLKKRTMDRLKRAQKAIDNWDPVEASAKEDYNRLKGGRRGPVPIDPLSVPELIQPIAPLDQNQYPYEQMGMPGV